MWLGNMNLGDNHEKYQEWNRGDWVRPEGFNQGNRLVFGGLSYGCSKYHGLVPALPDRSDWRRGQPGSHSFIETIAIEKSSMLRVKMAIYLFLLNYPLDSLVEIR